MSDELEEKIIIQETKEAIGNDSIESYEAEEIAPKTLKEELEKDGFEVEKGIEILEEKDGENMRILDSVGALPEEKGIGKDNQDLIEVKVEIAKDEYDENINALQGGVLEIKKRETDTEEERDSGLETEIKKEHNSSLVVEFYDKNDNMVELKKEYEAISKEIIELADEENKYYSKFFNGKNVVSGLVFDEVRDNFFAPDASQNIMIPLKNFENLPKTKILIKHEFLHKAIRMKIEDGKEWDVFSRDFKDLFIDNIKNGKDSNIEFIGNIKSGQFKEYLSSGSKYSGDMSAKTKEEKLGMIVFDNYGESNNDRISENIEYVIEEVLADEALFNREKEKDLNGVAERITDAKITAFDDIAKNEGYKSWKEYPLSGSSKAFFGNCYNMCKFLSRINADAGRDTESKEFDDFANSSMEKFKNSANQKYGEDFSEELDDLAEKFQNLIKK